MDNPASLINRAVKFKQLRLANHQQALPQPGVVLQPRHTSSHASYTALMRSHDRVSTRHIAPGNGA